MDQLPSTPTELLTAFRTLNPTSPRLSWYGPDSERVEFSGRVLENWVAKTANYLVDELDAESGSEVAVDLPLHWRSFVWLLATWATGATVATPDAVTTTDVRTTTDSGSALLGDSGAVLFGGSSLPNADIVATANPAQVWEQLNSAGRKPSPLVVAVALPALAMRWMGELPPRTLDYSGDVRSHADVFFADETPSIDEVAWRHGSAVVSYGELLASGDSSTAEAPQRVLLQARDGWDAVVRAALTTWANGGSVVLLGEGVEPTAQLRSSENVTAG